jgi:hypothetical protein
VEYFFNSYFKISSLQDWVYFIGENGCYINFIVFCSTINNTILMVIFKIEHIYNKRENKVKLNEYYKENSNALSKNH